MKHIFSLLILILGFTFANCQDNKQFKATWDTVSLDWTLEEITIISPFQESVTRYYGLDTIQVQDIINRSINDDYQRAAIFHIRSFDFERSARVKRLGMIAVGVDNYFETKRNELDSAFVHGPGWRYRNTGTGVDMTLSTLYRENNTTVLRDTLNANAGTITPYSLYYIRMNPLNSFDENEQIFFFSDDGVLYRGETSTGNNVILLKNN